MNKQSKQSAGLLMFRRTDEEIEVFLVHPGGPFWAKKDEGAWTIPKGEFDNDEDALSAARREFHEETGFTAQEPYLDLGSVKQKSGKVVYAWAFAGDCDPEQLVSNTCAIEWPPRSGNRMVISEVDRGAWFSVRNAAQIIRQEQRDLLSRLERALSAV